MFKIIKYIIISICLPCTISAQNYLWPVKAKKELTAIFGEERPGRYHTGIDVRTFGNIGYELIAIDSGYISRIRTSSKGYGKTVYIKLNDGNTAVYAHLDHFTPELDNLVNALHQEYKQYTIDHRLKSNEYPVIKGEIIGYSGDTGGVSGPHLHFELRNNKGQPINPFGHSLDIQDNEYPEIEYLAVIPLDEKAEIDGFKEQKVFPLQKINDQKYILSDTIFVSGNVGLAVRAIDKITNQYFNFGIYSANLLLDAKFIYSMQYDEINWENVNKIHSEKNYSLARKGKGKFYHLFTQHNNQELTFINGKSQPGYYFDQKVIHDAIIDIFDYAQNRTELHAYFVSDTLPKFNYNVELINKEYKITFIDNNYFRPYFFKTGPTNKDEVIPIQYFDMGNNIYKTQELIKPFNVLKVYAKNKSGVSSIPTFHMEPANNFSKLDGQFEIKHYDHGLIISFKEKTFSGMDAYLSMKKNGRLFSYKLYRDTKLTLSSDLLSPLELINASELKIYYKNKIPYEIFSTNIEGEIIYPDSSFEINLMNNQLIINGEKNTFYDTTFIWIESAETNNPREGKFIKDPFYLRPYLIPFNKNIEVSIAVDPAHIRKNLGIYYYNQNKHKWNYLPSYFSSDSTYISTSISSGEIFSIISENNPPVLSQFIPDINGTYYSSDIKHISFYAKDSFSGLEGEKDIIVMLDDNPIIFEYNSYQNKIRYPLKYNLKKGLHTLYVQASDKVGNQTIVKGSFNIK